MSKLMISRVTHSATSSPASGCGVTPCDGQAGLMIGRYGRGPHPANPGLSLAGRGV